jgi:hypothetical protein
LAPLEFVLALPILVIMMALMVNFGVAGAWKVRAQVNTRYAAWRTVNARTGEYNPRPAYWPQGVALNTNTGADLPMVSQIWDSQQDLLCPCVRGPNLTAPSAEVPVNVKGRLELDGSVLEGSTSLSRPLPVLRTALPGGQFQFNLKQDIFDNQWQFYSLNIPWNNSIRALVWWNIEHADLATLDAAISQNLQLLNNNLQTLQTAPTRPFLYPLDADDEFNRYNNGENTTTWSSPDFYPRLARACQSDPNVVYNQFVSRIGPNGKANPNSLLSRIDNLPCSMSTSFLNLYKKWICQLEQCQFSDGAIDPLRQRYNDLSQFVGTLRGCKKFGPLKRCECPPGKTCTCPPSPVGVGF